VVPLAVGIVLLYVAATCAYAPRLSRPFHGLFDDAHYGRSRPGMPADQRSDVFSFGSVVYEMLTGRQAFRGDSAPAILAAVLIGAPDLSAIPANLNARLIDLVRRCLEKNPKQRWQAVGDLRMELEAIAAAPHAGSAVAAAAQPAPLWQRMIPVAAGVLLTAAVTSAAWWRARPAAPPPPIVAVHAASRRRNAIHQLRATSSARVSPDGTNIVVARTPVCISARWLISPPDQSPAPGASECREPVFDPSGRWIVFYSTAEQTLQNRGRRRRSGHALPFRQPVWHELGSPRESCSSAAAGDNGHPARVFR
jgi:plasmid stabilization system protein ParE